QITPNSFRKILMILLILTSGKHILSAQTPQFILSATHSGISPEAYCEVVTVKLTITNLGATSAFTGDIRFRPYDWQIVDYSAVPNATVDFDPQAVFHHIYFTTHTLGTDEKYEIYYDILSKAHHDADFKLDHFVTRSANQATLLSDPQFLPIQHSPIPYPGYTSIHVSDILDDYDGGGGPGILSPPAPIPPES